MRNLISLATGTSHELYVYMIDQRGHLQKKRSCRWKGEKEGGGERDGRGMGEGGERVGKDISGQASSVAVVFVCTWSRSKRASNLLLNSYLVVKFLKMIRRERGNETEIYLSDEVHFLQEQKCILWSHDCGCSSMVTPSLLPVVSS